MSEMLLSDLFSLDDKDFEDKYKCNYPASKVVLDDTNFDEEANIKSLIKLNEPQSVSTNRPVDVYITPPTYPAVDIVYATAPVAIDTVGTTAPAAVDIGVPIVRANVVGYLDPSGNLVIHRR